MASTSGCVIGPINIGVFSVLNEISHAKAS